MIEVNYLAILLAGVASMVVGFVWYMFLFAKPWMAIKGYTKESIEADKQNMGKTYGISFVSALLTAYVLSHVIVMSEAYFHYSWIQTGLTSAIWMWIGFVFTTQLTGVLFEKVPVKLFLINTGNLLASLVAMGLVLGWMR